MKKKLKVVGLDPSLRNWGIAIGSVPLDTGILTIESVNTIHTTPLPDHSKISKSTWDISSARHLHEGVQEAIKDADMICVEVPYGSQDVKAAVGRGICLGVLGSLEGKNFIFVTPQSVKKIIGDPKATKADSVHLAYERHPEANWPIYRGKVSVTKAEHQADAIHAIYAGAQTKLFKSIIQEYKHASANQTPTQD